MAENELTFRIGLTLIPGVGDVNGKKLVAYCGSAEAVFKEKKQALLKIPGVGLSVVNSISKSAVLGRAEQEISFIKKNGVSPLFFTDPGYPARLLNCPDSPLMLYLLGNASMNASRTVALVGTRRATNYGKEICQEMVTSLGEKGIQVISGLAYGIDSCAHRRSVELQMETIGVLGHGLDRIYPPQNRKLAAKMVECGGLLTEFLSGTGPDRENFPKRNRIVAGMADAVIVVESGKRGGAIITAELANSYNRDVFAVPGRVGDEMSAGCHFLIRTNRAALAEKGSDVAFLMGWDEKPVKKRPQAQLFVDLSDDEQHLLSLIRDKTILGIDELVIASGMPTTKIAAALLKLEFEGLVVSLPGKRFRA